MPRTRERTVWLLIPLPARVLLTPGVVATALMADLAILFYFLSWKHKGSVALGVALVAFTFWEVAAAAATAAATALNEPTLSVHVLVLKRELGHTLFVSLQSLGVFIASVFLIGILVLESALCLILSYPRGMALAFMAACAVSL
jgi:hypothetical protein